MSEIDDNIARFLEEGRVWRADHPTGGGGFVLPATDTSVRPRLTREAIAAFLPDRGGFTFPDPYGTFGVRVTNADDCPGGVDYGYSYWRKVYNQPDSGGLLVLVGCNRQRGGQGPSLFSVNKQSGEVQSLGPVFGPDDPKSWATAEQWYFSAQRPAIYLPDGPSLLRHDVVSRETETVFTLPSVGTYLWQPHSSDDDRVHSATVRDTATEQMLGAVVYRTGAGVVLHAKSGDYDECQIDASGRWLIIKDGPGGGDNRILDLETGDERTLRNIDGAAGHSDCGRGTLVGEDDYHALPGALLRWDLAHLDQPGTVQYHLTQWGSGLGHVAVAGSRALISHASREDWPRVNELVVVELDGSLSGGVVAPNLVDLRTAPGDYAALPKACMDAHGEWALWIGNCGTERGDAFLVRL